MEGKVTFMKAIVPATPFLAEVLLKTIVQATPFFATSFFKLPENLCQDIEMLL